MIAVFAEHIFRSSFHWDTHLTDKRKDEIIKWVRGLKDKQVSMLNDITDDVKDAQEYSFNHPLNF